MKVRLLGTAAGGGIPQWNCACPACDTARRAGVSRTQDCVAISGDGRDWHLLNASPDLRTQLLATPELAPGPGRRQTPLRGVLLTTAELDHTLGLVTLREAESLAIYGPPAVLAALSGPFPVRQLLDHYTKVSFHPLMPDTDTPLSCGLVVRPIPAGAKRPRYAADLPDGQWVVAYRISDPRTGGVLVYAPCLPRVDDAFLAAVAGACCVILDGTFLTDDEMLKAAGTGRTATAMGHLPIVDSLAAIAGVTGVRVIYTHLNNTNPVAVSGSPERNTAEAHGVEVAEDGAVFTL